MAEPIAMPLPTCSTVILLIKCRTNADNELALTLEVALGIVRLADEAVRLTYQ